MNIQGVLLPKLTGKGLLQRFSNVDIAPLKPTEGLEWGTGRSWSRSRFWTDCGRRSATIQWRSKMVARSSEGLCDEIIMAIGVGASRMSLV